MKSLKILAVVALCLGGVALAAATIVPQMQRLWFQNGIVIQPAANGSTTSNAAITRSAEGHITYDFASLSSAGAALECDVTSAMTTTGARFGDQCFVGTNLGVDGGDPLPIEATLKCFVSANNATKVQLCVHYTDGGSLNLADAGYYTRTFSNQ